MRLDLKKEFFEFLKQKMEKKGITFETADFDLIEEEIIGAVSDVGKGMYEEALAEKLGGKREGNTIETPSGKTARYKGRKKKLSQPSLEK